LALEVPHRNSLVQTCHGVYVSQKYEHTEAYDHRKWSSGAFAFTPTLQGSSSSTKKMATTILKFCIEVQGKKPAGLLASSLHSKVIYQCLSFLEDVPLEKIFWKASLEFVIFRCDQLLHACFKLTWIVSCRLNNPCHAPFLEAEVLLPAVVAAEEASYPGHPLHGPVPHPDPLALHPEGAEVQSLLLSL
jgi:hypothetical protein